MHMQDRNNRQEALTWAIDHVAKLPPPSAQHWPRVLCGPLEDEADAEPCSPAAAAYALELLRMFCESRPADATAILSRYRPEVGLANLADMLYIGWVLNALRALQLQKKSSNVESQHLNVCRRHLSGCLRAAAVSSTS